MSRFSVLACFLCCPGLLVAQQEVVLHPTVKPNIIVFLADDMGAGDTSAYQDWSKNSDADQLDTPAMEELARRGIRFTDAHSPHSRCTTTRYALMTGRYCWRTAVKHWVLFGNHGDPLIERDRLTMPEMLQQAGYRTGMVGKWHLGLTYRKSDGSVAEGFLDADLRQPMVDTPIDHGFDFFYGISRSHPTSGPGGLNRKNIPEQTTGPGWIHGRTIVGATDSGRQLTNGSYDYWRVGNVMDREALNFLNSMTTTAQPFFLYFASPANHGPYTPSKEIAGIKVEGASQYKDGKRTESLRQDFVYQNDVHLRRLIDYLEETEDPRRKGRPLIENTIVVFTSDNGAEKNDKRFTGPLRSNKGSTFEGGHRVPFIVSWPLGQVGDGNPQTPGAIQSSLLALNDLYATFAEIAGVKLPPIKGMGRGAEDSISQLDAFRGDREFVRRGAVFPNDHQEASKKLADERAVVAVRSNAAPVEGRWKLFLDHQYAFDGIAHPTALYELHSDPKEETDLLGDPKMKLVVEFLLKLAQDAAGDNGASR